MSTRWPLRRVVERVEVPYDTDLSGQPITVSMDVLECGHRRTTPARQYPNFDTAHNIPGVTPFSQPLPEYRRCPKCPPEEES